MADKAIIDIAKILVAHHFILNKEKSFDIEKILLPLIEGWSEFGDNGPTITVVSDLKGISFKSVSLNSTVENLVTWSEVPNGSDLKVVLEFIESILRQYFYKDEV